MPDITITPIEVHEGAPVPARSTVTKRVYHGGGIPTDAERMAKRTVQQDLAKSAVTLDKDSRAAVAAHQESLDKSQGGQAKVSPPEEPVASKEKEVTADPATKKVQETTKKEPSEDQVARANRIEARNREREARLKQLEEQNSKLQLSAKELEEIRNLSKTDQIALLEKLGLDLESIGKAQIAKGRSPKPADKQADPLEKVQQELEEIKKREAEQQETSRFQQGLQSFINVVNDAIRGKEADYELMVLHANERPTDPRWRNKTTEDAVQVQAAAAQEGRDLTPKEIADALEAYYVSEEEAKFSLISSSKKLQEKFGLTKKQADKVEAEVAKPEAKKKGYAAAPNLTSAQMKSPASNVAPKAKRLPDRERLAAAIAWGKAEYAKEQLRKAGG